MFSAIRFWMIAGALGVVMLAVGDAAADKLQRSTYQEPNEGMLFEGDLDGNYTTFVGKWANPCVTYNAVDPELAAWAEQSLNNIWGSVSPVRSCGNVLLGTENITITAVPTGSLGPNVLGQAGCGAIGGLMVHCTVAIATNGRSLPVVAHELGHTLGMGHSQRADQLMSAFCCNPLGADDIAGIRFLYGAGASTPIPVTPTVPIPPITLVPTATSTPVPPTATPTPRPVFRVFLPWLARD